ncbi:hypothetical protein [Dactylosporangium matsuzakiense]|uniref:hypothetical protein n=1 Tax=Dactylosporangium matsuzakiense TaxID=53360 RepID=UPI0021C31BCA|nr:hypothetical protein [Dactylosporangium matsuzakiense]UWZ41386.1 hypothetical protein Dmats_27355 [Dactylosporangium matsuzakiense]
MGTRTSAGYVAASVRARGLARRRMGPAARGVATRPGLDAALVALSATAYGRGVHPGQSVAGAQDGIAATLLWHLRVLAGWLPPGGAEVLRAAAGWFEIANVERRLRELGGRTSRPPFELGALATAWPRLARAGTVPALLGELAASGWCRRDPGTDRGAMLAMRLSWARRMAGFPAAEAWAAGGAALLVARERWLGEAEDPTAAPLIGSAAFSAASWPEFVAALPARAAWPFATVGGPQDLWLGEAAWWRRLESGGLALLRRGGSGEDSIVGAAAVLAADAWRVRAALACAADGGDAAVFDAVMGG